MIYTIHDLDFDAAAHVDTTAELRLSGSADTNVVARLVSLIDELHRDATAAGIREILVDIRGLEFMNASCFKAFVNWLTLIHDLEPRKRYQLRFRTNDRVAWQQRSLHTLSCFATDLVVVEG